MARRNEVNLDITTSGSNVYTFPAASGTLLIGKITTYGDVSTTIASTDRVVATSATLTAARTWTLPAANALKAGEVITVIDAFGGINGANVLGVQRAGSDTIQKQTSVIQLFSKYGSMALMTDGTSNWYILYRIPAASYWMLISGTTFTPSPGVRQLYVECVGGGGAG